MTNQIAIFIMGPPGAGKSTLADFLSSIFAIKKVSAGELIRNYIDKGDLSEEGIFIKNLIENGFGIDGDLIIELYDEHLDSSVPGYVFDGNANSGSQANNIIELLSRNGVSNMICIFLRCPKDVCVARILTRKVVRTDSDIETIQNRFTWYHSRVINAFKTLSSNIPTIEVDARKPPDDISAEVIAFCKNQFPQLRTNAY